MLYKYDMGYIMGVTDQLREKEKDIKNTSVKHNESQNLRSDTDIVEVELRI